MVDSHTHLNQCKLPNDELVAEAMQLGVTKMVTIGMGADGAREALEIAEGLPQVYAAVGIHPNDTTGFKGADLHEIRHLAQHPKCVAVGETGLDYFRDHADIDDQRRSFVAHTELARELQMPLVVHSREADNDTLEVLTQHATDLKVIIHCFSMGDRIDECLDQPNWWISFAGNVTYPRNHDLRAAAAKVPTSRLLVETDAPYLTPQAVRGEPNRTANVTLTAEVVADERDLPYHEFDQGVEAASAAVFGW